MVTERVKSHMEYEDSKKTRSGLRFETRLDEDTEAIINSFDSMGDKTVQSFISELSGAQIRAVRQQMESERRRLTALLAAMDDVEDQILRSLR